MCLLIIVVRMSNYFVQQKSSITNEYIELFKEYKIVRPLR